jgi:hypothetical protein
MRPPQIREVRVPAIEAFNCPLKLQAGFLLKPPASRDRNAAMVFADFGSMLSSLREMFLIDFTASELG